MEMWFNIYRYKRRIFYYRYRGEFFMAVTIKDVAKLAGVSPSTVSRTCKNHPSISQETKDRVKKAMEKKN